MDLSDSSAVQDLLRRTTQLHQEMAQAQDEMRAARVNGSAGGGAVRASVDARGRLEKLTIAPVVADPGNARGLADMILAAVRDAQSTLAAQQEAMLGPVLNAINDAMRDF